MTKTGNIKKGTLIVVNEAIIRRHFFYQKEYWFFGEYEYVNDGIFFADESDVEIFNLVKDMQHTVAGRLFLARLNVLFIKLEELIEA